VAYFTRYFTDYFDVEVASTQQPTGGWGAANDYQLERLRRRRHKKLEELEAEADRLEAALIAAKTLPPNPTVEAKVAVREYAPRAVEFNRRAQRAISYAQRAKTDLAYQLAAREIARELEDEEFAIMTLLAHIA
jgi:hypothetical protein